MTRASQLRLSIAESHISYFAIQNSEFVGHVIQELSKSTRNTFGGTWYLPHRWLHYHRDRRDCHLLFFSGGKIREVVVRCWPWMKIILTFQGCYLCATFGKHRPWECTQTDTHTDRQTDRQTNGQMHAVKLNIICPMLYAITKGHIKMARIAQT